MNIYMIFNVGSVIYKGSGAQEIYQSLVKKGWNDNCVYQPGLGQAIWYFQGNCQEGQSTSGEVWAVTFRKSITENYLLQDMDAAGRFSCHYNYASFLLSEGNSVFDHREWVS